MQAARYHGPGAALQVETLPIPAIGPEDVLIRVTHAGVCRTELHFLSGLLNLGIAPLTLGHEMVGEVVDAGPEVHTLLLGTRVVVNYYGTCGQCYWCRAGQQNLCSNVVAQLGFTADGGYAEFVKVRADMVVPIPTHLDAAQACTLGCSATTALHAARRIAPVQLGDTVLIYGAGGVGYALVQVCKLSGARVLVVGRSERKLRLAQELGADVVIQAGQEAVAETVRRHTDNEGVDIIFELVGTRETMDQSLQSLRKRGRLVFIGYSEDHLIANPLLLVIGELQILASVGSTQQDLLDAVALAARGQLRQIIDRVVPLAQVNDTLHALQRGEVAGRAVLQP
jgi:2-desacetyl-2-hydroxyethyl bacteriochlorophyllide A dehydrogenase